MIAQDKFAAFAGHVSFRGLECPHLFNIKTDELYELDEDGACFVAEVDGTRRAGEVANRELLEYSDSEGLLEYLDAPADRPLKLGASPAPSLRYLELMVTRRCNLSCRHCYLGDCKSEDMSPDLLSDVLDQFDEMQGLRLLVTGGEPLMYPHLERLGDLIRGRGFRSVLLTNGVMLDRNKLDLLPVHEVQVSLDGLEHGHDRLRGKGTFNKAAAAARMAVERGIDLSIATMIHAGNADEMEDLERFVRELGAKEWSLEYPTELGRWSGPDKLGLPIESAAELAGMGFGGSYHGSAEGYACGLHLATVTPAGELLPCAFYPDKPLGRVANKGLRTAWAGKKSRKIEDLTFCSDCEAAPDCAGGCRKRAGGDGPDLFMCAAHGWPKGRPENTGSD